MESLVKGTGLGVTQEGFYSDLKVKLAAVWKPQDRKNHRGFCCPLHWFKRWEGGVVTQFGCFLRSSYCLIMPSFLLTVLSVGACGRQSAVCWFSGMIHLLRKGIPHVSPHWLLWGSHAWSPYRNHVLSGFKAVFSPIQCECGKMRRGHRKEINKAHR